MVCLTTKARISLIISLDATIRVLILNVTLAALLYRIDNNIIFEELKSMEKSSNALTTVLEKDSKLTLVLNFTR